MQRRMKRRAVMQNDASYVQCTSEKKSKIAHAKRSRVDVVPDAGVSLDDQLKRRRR